MIRKGQVVKVYHDPVSCKKLEGNAKLIKKYETKSWKQEYWHVKFLDDGFVTDRFINTENH